MTARRGEIWTIAGGAGRLTSKPRPALVLQSDLFDAMDSVTVVFLTTDLTSSPTRVPVAADDLTGISRPSFAMADKITTVRRTNLGERCGRVDTSTMLDVERGVAVFLGLAG
ncbi:type II toxin-antitoxin system PemK/MazF family toxin [Isoptericola croceus]|uniref:type II toxin-antitoxin system PemK/MazF family toxin n=1 Tax=Isoptericola croceus TaxID=3031406 RepID=UPI0023FA1C94|nr:type II toxin-antitoxin system PemK/MazF family toxin [Isoptericola croceus]